MSNTTSTGGGGGGGTVTSVTGTANRITVTGTTAPVVDIASTYVGQASITTLGTITTGTWNGTAVGPTFGGTGQTTYASGDMLYASAANTLSKLAKGADGQVLTLASGFPTWAPASGGIPTIGTSTDRGIVTWNGTTGAAVRSNTVLVNAASQFVADAGTAALPSLCFTSNVNMGFFRSSADTMGISFFGTQFASWSGSGMSAATAGRYFLQETASDANPTYGFSGDTNTGFYRSAADTTQLVNNGIKTITMDASNRVTFPVQPSFLAYLATTATDKTGNGGSYTLGTDALTSVFNRGSNFNTNGTFTAPITGLYDLTAQITITGATIATSFVLSIVTTARTYKTTFSRAAAATDQTVTLNCLADMSATNTATVTIVANGEAANTDDIKGGATLESYFCGTLVA